MFLQEVIWPHDMSSLYDIELRCDGCREYLRVDVTPVRSSQWIGVGEGTLTGLSVQVTPDTCPVCDTELHRDDVAQAVSEHLS